MIKFILRFFATMPLRFNHFIGSLIGRYLYLTDSDSKAVVKKNIQACFSQMNEDEQDELVKKSLIETGKGLSETGYIWLKSFKKNQQKICKTTGIGQLESDQPVILLVPHFGCWEVTARVVSLIEPVTFLYKPLKKPSQEKLLISNRQQGDLSMASADKKGVIQLQRAIKNKQLIGILPDQDPGKEGGVVVPFFNTSARTMTLLAKLARKNKAKVILTWALRLPKGRGYELNFKEVNISSESGKVERDVRLMNQAIEELVLTKPEQYLWNYKRFKVSIKY